MDFLAQLELEFGEITECKWAGQGHPLFREGENMSQTVSRVMPDADWVITCGRPPEIVKGKRSYKVALVVGDLHGNSVLGVNMMGFINHINNAGLDAVLLMYTQIAKPKGPPPKGFTPRIFLERLTMPIFHMPPSINPELFKPIDKQKEHDVAFLASHWPSVYPFRHRIWNGLRPLAEEHGWKIIMRARPQGDSLKRNIDQYIENGFIVGPKYAETLALTKVFIFGLGQFKYPTTKFAEGMASRTCIMTDPCLTAEELHFIPDWNFVNITPKNWKEKLVYYVKNDGEREEITQNGYNTFLKYHTNEVRAKQLQGFLEEHR